VTAAPPAQGERSAETTAPRRLRYIAVPPGEKVAGMARARILLKHGKRTAHRPHQAHKKAAGKAIVKKPTENNEPAAKH